MIINKSFDVTGEYNRAVDLYCLLGSPVFHSLSPFIHNYSFKSNNISSIYLALDIKASDFYDFIRSFPLMFSGANLTMPLKTIAIESCDEISKRASISGSVNTLKLSSDGRILGYDTDGEGLCLAIEERGIDIKGKNISLLGSGAAARSIITALSMRGVGRINIHARDNSSFRKKYLKFKKQLSEISDSYIDILTYEDSDLSRSLLASDIVINASSLGMDEDDISYAKSSMFRKDILAIDIVYKNRKSDFLIKAEEAGCEIMNGLPMLIHQAAAAFYLWTGKNMPINEIKQRIEASK